MAGEAEQLATLREFGLSAYCSRAYLALVELGRTDARAVSRVARIPPAKIYVTLDQLSEKGLARVHLDRPKRFEAVPFAEFVERRQADHLAEARRLAASVDRLGRLFALPARANTSDRGSFGIVRGRGNVNAKQLVLAGEVSKSLLVSPSLGSLSRPGALRAMLDAARPRGVKPRIVVPPTPRGMEGPASWRSVADVRQRTIERGTDGSVTFAIFDRRQAMVTHHVPDDDRPDEGHDVSIHITEAGVVASLFELIDERWQAAKPFPRGK